MVANKTFIFAQRENNNKGTNSEAVSRMQFGGVLQEWYIYLKIKNNQIYRCMRQEKTSLIVIENIASDLNHCIHEWYCSIKATLEL